MNQLSFSDAEYAGKCKQTCREILLAEMEQVVPWRSPLNLIEPVYPVAGRGRHSAAFVGIEGGAVSEGEKFAPDVVGVSGADRVVLGPASKGRGYWVATSGNVTDEVWKKYIEDQKPELPDDDFKAVTVGPEADCYRLEPSWEAIAFRQWSFTTVCITVSFAGSLDDWVVRRCVCDGLADNGWCGDCSQRGNWAGNQPRRTWFGELRGIQAGDRGRCVGIGCKSRLLLS
jgi:hypothetical protein